MKGLLRNSYYGSQGSAVISIAFFATLGIGLLITGTPVLLMVIGMACPAVLSFNALSSFRKESSSKWENYIITSPVRRKDIVLSRYITHLAWTLGGVIIAFSIIGLTVLIHGNRFFFDPLRDSLMVLCLSLGIPILIGSIFYPLAYLLGTDKSEIIMIIGLISAIGITAGAIWVLNYFFGFSTLSTAEFLLGISAYMLLAIVLFVISFFVSVLLNNMKDY